MSSTIKCISSRADNVDQKLNNENISFDELYSNFSDVEKVTHLVRQSLILRYFHSVYNDAQFSFFISYAQLLRNMIKEFKSSYRESTDELECNIIKNGLKCINFLSLNSTTTIADTSDQEIMFFCEGHPEIPSIGNMSAYVHFLCNTGDHHSGRYREKDEHLDIGVFKKSDYCKIKTASIQMPFNISSNNIFHTTELRKEYEFDPRYFNNLNNGTRKSFLTYLSCFDWSNTSVDNVIRTLGNFCLDSNKGVTCKGLSSIYTHAYMNYILCKQDILGRSVQPDNDTKNNVTHFMRTIRNKFRISVTDKNFLNDIFFSNNNMSGSDKLTRQFLEAKHPSEVTKEMRQAYLNNRYIGGFEELDILSNVVSLEAESENDDEDSSGEEDDNMDTEDTGDDTGGDEVDEDTPEEDTDGESDSDDENSEEDSEGDEEDTEEEAQPEKEPVDANTKMSDRSGVELIIDDETTFDEILYRQEIYDRIDILINKLDLPVEDVTLLINLKKYWLNLLSVKSIQDILTTIVGKKNYN